MGVMGFSMNRGTQTLKGAGAVIEGGRAGLPRTKPELQGQRAGHVAKLFRHHAMPQSPAGRGKRRLLDEAHLCETTPQKYGFDPRPIDSDAAQEQWRAVPFRGATSNAFRKEPFRNLTMDHAVDLGIDQELPRHR